MEKKNNLASKMKRLEEIVEKLNENAEIPMSYVNGKLHADLKTAIKNELKKSGITKIPDDSECTFCGEGYFSYRRDKTEKRHATFVVIS